MIDSMVSDFHTHVLPGVDDGSRDVEQSLEMLRLMYSQGIRRVVATPHFYPSRHTPAAFLSRRDTAFRALREAMGTQPLPEVIPAAEVHYFPGMSDCDELRNLCVAGTSCILVEMPGTLWSDRMLMELRDMAEKGITPILAHIDRYHPRTAVRRLAGLPVLVQANAVFFRDPFTRHLALKLLREDRIHLLGSDSHNMSGRSPDLEPAVAIIRKKLGQSALDRVVFWESRVLQSSTGNIL